MNDQFKLSSKRLSVALAISVAVVLAVTVAVLTIALAMQTSTETSPAPDDIEDSSQTPTPLPSDKPSKEENKNEKPSDPPSEKEDEKEQETVVPLPEEPKWTTPVDGYVFKEHSTEDLVYSLTLGDYRTHSGIDISASAGSEVKCCLDGTVSAVFYDPMMGYCVSVSHSGGMVSHYKNLGERIPENIKEGATVKSGDLLGYVGESAMIEFADEAHLHFEIVVNEVESDPLDYLAYAKDSSDTENE